MAIVPKKLHAIWLGGILREAGKKNIAMWKKANPDYEMNIWIDSSTFLTDFSPAALEQKKEYLQFKQWAKENKVIINDINPDVMDAELQNHSDIFNNMKSQVFYQQEIASPGANFGAASDILRVEILFNEGGVYYDCEDVSPEIPLKYLPAWEKDELPLMGLRDLVVSEKSGILVHAFSGKLNNDLLASIPGAPDIARFRDEIEKNYQELYARGEKFVMAHRFQQLSSFITFGQDKLKSTMKISGPTALRKIVGPQPVNTFPDYWRIVENTQALSWVDKISTYGAVEQSFRLNYIEYLTLITDRIMTEDVDAEIRYLLEKFQYAIHSESKSISLIELHKIAKTWFTDFQLQKINAATANIFEKFKQDSFKLEELFLYCRQGKVPVTDLRDFLNGREFYAAFKADHPLGIVHFFQEQLDKGFFELIQLHSPSEEYPLIWHCAFSEEEKTALRTSVETEIEKIKMAQESGLAFNLNNLESALFRSIEKYATHWNSDNKYRRQDGEFDKASLIFFGSWREAGLTSKVFKALSLDSAVSLVNDFLKDPATSYAPHDFAFFLIDELKQMVHSPWSNLVKNQADSYEKETIATRISAADPPAFGLR